MAEGLRFGAAKGLIHRDIKPSNILRSKQGDIKITDLGLALQTEFEDERVTREGTTVGTVDYMAPEQARDSRAASSQSDLYSLGCTLYYLLTGIPPYPGGDITDKLTRHARSAPPDIRDLRPDVPEALSRIMLRMMAKRTEDRFASFDDLIQALDSVPLRDGGDSPGVALVPLEEPDSDGFPDPRGPWRRAGDSGRSGCPPADLRSRRFRSRVYRLTRPGSALQHLHPCSGPRARTGRLAAAGRDAICPRASRHARGVDPGYSHQPSLSSTAWISLCVAIGASFVFMVIVIDRLVRTSPANSVSPPLAANRPEGDMIGPPIAVADSPSPPSRPRYRVERSRGISGLEPRPVRPQVAAAVEPVDVDPPADVDSRLHRGDAQKVLAAIGRWLPYPQRVEGPLIQVRRVAKSREPMLFPSLRLALNETRGTVEIADEGPFAINDFRVPGESRLIRARHGYHPIIRIDRPNLEAVWSLPGVIVLQEGKSLTLDSLDMIVNVRDLMAMQTFFFSCTGASLTVRNCTITLVNPANQPFTLVRAEGTSARGSRIRFEKTLIRGPVSAGFELGKGAVDVAVRETVFLGSQGPLVRRLEAEPKGSQRFSVVGGVMATRGPGFELKQSPRADAQRKAGPLVIRAFDSVFGRFQGAGIASVIFAENPGPAPSDQVDWSGQQNLFCGWMGYYASGPEQTLKYPAWRCSVPRGTEPIRAAGKSSRRGRSRCTSARRVPADLAPFIPGREKSLSQTAAPRPFLGPQDIMDIPGTRGP